MTTEPAEARTDDAAVMAALHALAEHRPRRSINLDDLYDATTKVHDLDAALDRLEATKRIRVWGGARVVYIDLFDTPNA